MASIVLSAAGSAIGGSVGGPLGALFGSKLGQLGGGSLDKQWLGTKKLADSHGPRLAELGVQTSTYGKMIPIVYGLVRIAGNVIWARSIKEIETTTTSSAGIGGKGGGGRVTQSQSTYSYYITLAVAVCEGEISGIQRMWADAKQIELSTVTLRIYTGSEEQLPDSLIQSIEGVDNTPAYRGLAYVVIEDFPLAEYGNRIPNFTFEVQKKMQSPDYAGQITEHVVSGITLIPGAGEYVYDTETEMKVPGMNVGGQWIQQGAQASINQHTAYGKSNALVALDQLRDTCPNIAWVSVVVSWFGDSVDSATCQIKPGVEYQTGATTSPDVWQVGSYTRTTARQITLVDGSPQYGGTPDDNGVLRLLDELRGRGYNIMFYPMLFMDVADKPWRGTLTGSAASISNFFTQSAGFNNFITHYATLVNGKVDAFVIGSELVGLTKVTSSPGNYPAVNELVSLAATVKGILGSGTKVTYAADWSEYHHTDGGWYNLDPLWASSNIDMIGIDAYFPLTDSAEDSYDIDTIKAGWTSGEGYDWYYTDMSRTIKASLSAPYAWKNIAWFWSHTHTNPDASTTAWVPESKKIWFTEYGFPSVDKATNQPNVFYDPTSSSSGLPYFSKGRVDFKAQRAGITATEHQWPDSGMVEQKFLWTWDARPYPYWPDLKDIWADGASWKTGHWVQGKFGVSSLSAIVADLCARAGLQSVDYTVSALSDQVEGFVIPQRLALRDAVEQLQGAYFFDCVESDYRLKFVPRAQHSALDIDGGELVADAKGAEAQAFGIIRTQEHELPRRVNVLYMNRLYQYQTAAQYAERQTTLSNHTLNLDLPVVLSDQTAIAVADITLFSLWAGRTAYQFMLPLKYAVLEPADVVNVLDSGVSHRIRITGVMHGGGGMLRVEGIAEKSGTYDFYRTPALSMNLPDAHQAIADTELDLLDLPALPGDSADAAYLRLAACGVHSNWQGATLFRADNDGGDYQRLSDISGACVIGSTIGALANGAVCVFDYASSVTVLLIGDGALQSAGELSVLNGANAALIGDEIIQFTTASLIEPGKYTLTGLLRGRLGTEWAIASHVAAERFVLLGSSIGKLSMPGNLFGVSRSYKGVSIGNTLSITPGQDFTYQARALKPYSPVHLMGARDGSGNLTISWVRRGRINAGWQDNIDVPLGEVAELYEVEILHTGAVVRTITGLTSASATYSAAQQTTDFGSVQSSVSVRVYQISALVGRGYPGSASV